MKKMIIKLMCYAATTTLIAPIVINCAAWHYQPEVPKSLRK